MMSQMFRFDEVEIAAVPYHSFLKKNFHRNRLYLNKLKTEN